MTRYAAARAVLEILITVANRAEATLSDIPDSLAARRNLAGALGDLRDLLFRAERAAAREEGDR